MRPALLKLFALFSGRQRIQFCGLVVLLLINAILEMVGLGLAPLFVKILISKPATETAPAWTDMSTWIPSLSESPLVAGGVALAMVFALKAMYAFVANLSVALFVRQLVKQLGTRLFDAYLEAPYLFHVSHNSADLVRNVMVEVSQLSSKVLLPLIGIIANSLIAIALLFLVSIFLPLQVTIWAICFLGCAAVIVGLIQRTLKRLGGEVREVRSKLLQTTNEGLGAYREIRLLDRVGFFTHRFEQTIERQTAIQEFIRLMERCMPPLMEFIAVAGVMLFLVSTSSIFEKPEELLPALTVLIVVTARLKGVTTSMLGHFAQLRHNLISVDIVYNDIRQTAAVTERWRAGPISTRVRPTLSFSNVSFRYPGQNNSALQDIELTINDGEMVGIAGTTGSGKTTLVNMLLGFLAPDSGQFAIDGHTLSSTDLRSAIRMSYVPQDIFLVDGTIQDNIAFGIPDTEIDATALHNAAHAAHLDEFLQSLPKGLKTHIGERGAKLSGGQRQRIGIARALYRDPQLLVLDEATAALDNKTSHSVMNAIIELKGKRTIVLIAHRLETLHQCDRIIFLKNGRIDAIGSFDQLRNDCEAFSNLLKSQRFNQ